MCIRKYLLILLNLSLLMVPVNILWAQSLDGNDTGENLYDMSYEELASVIVTTASKTKEKIKEIPASVYVITQEDIQRYGYRNLEEVLRHIPGLYMVDNYDWTGQINFGVRGVMSDGGMDNFAVLLNGINMQNGMLGAYSIPHIGVPASSIVRVEVIRGPMSVVYGSGAFFGVVNVITHDFEKDSDEQLNHVQVSAGSQEGEVVAHLTGNFMDGLFRYSSNIGFTSTERIDESFKQFSMRTQGGAFNNSGNYLDDERLYFDFAGQLEKFSFNINHAQVDRGTLYLLPPDRPQEAENSRSHYRVKYNDDISENWNLDLSATYTETDFDLYYHPALIPGTYAKSTLESDGLTLEALTSYEAPTDNLDFKLGYVYESFDEPTNMFNLPAFGLNRHELSVNDHASHAIWSQLRKRFNEHWSIVLGLRIEEIDTRKVSMYRYDADGNRIDTIQDNYEPDTQILPQVALIYNINDDHLLKLMYATGYRDPSNISLVSELFDTGAVGLEQAAIDSIELSYLARIADDWQFTSSIYYSKLDDIISRASSTDPVTNDIVLISNNSGEMTSQGLELGIKGNLTEKLQLEVNMAFTDVENDNDELSGVEPGFSPNHQGSVNLLYQLTRKSTIGLSCIYVGNMETSWDPTTDTRQANGVGSYTLVDLNFRKEDFLTENAYLQIGIHNLFDKNYRYASNQNSANSGYDRGFPAAERSFLVTFGMRF